jgi:hypothetical protein
VPVPRGFASGYNHLTIMEIPAVVLFSLPGSQPGGRADGDLEDLLSQAVRLEIFPSVFNNLWSIGRTTSLPPGSLWLARYRKNYAQNVALQHEQSRVVDWLCSNGIPCRPVKGVNLTQLLYPDLSWREITDIDLLVPPERVAEAHARLKEFGLRDANRHWTRESLSRLVAQPSFAFPEVLLENRSGVLIELHWDWTGEHFPAGDPTEDCEAYLIYLCRHAGKHFWGSLQWVCDIELFLRRFEEALDWAHFWRLAKATGAERSCAASFHLCSLIFDHPLRDEHQAVSRSAGEALAREALASLFSHARPRWSDHPAWRLLKVYNWRQRFSRITGWLAPPPDQSTGWRNWLGRYPNLTLRAVARVVPTASWKKRLEKAADLSLADWWTLVKAWWMLLAVNAALRVFSFQRLARWAHALADDGGEAGDSAVRRTAWLVSIAANRQPFPARCLARSLALTRLLARRGIATELKIGVRKQDQFEAHAWVEWRGQIVNDPGGHYAPLERVRDHVNA